MKKSIICMLLILTLLVSALPLTAAAAETEAADTGADADEVISFSAGYGMSAAVLGDGSLWTWGNNGNYAVSNAGSGLCRGYNVYHTPTLVFTGSAKSVKVSKYSNPHYAYDIPVVAALKDDNSLWMWGYAGSGVIGPTTARIYTNRPHKVLEDVVSYDTSGYHSAAVTSDGSLYVWGKNNYGQLGMSTEYEYITTPEKVMDDAANVTLSDHATAVIKKDGSLWVWGDLFNSYGYSDTQVKVLDNIIDVSLGSGSIGAVTKDRKLYVWGNNSYGQLGLGDTRDRTEPVLNESLEDVNVNDIEMGISSSFAITSILGFPGMLRVWGNNSRGQLGNGHITSTNAEPERIKNSVEAVSTSGSHTLALTSDGKLWAWGYNDHGELGDRSYESKTKPVEIEFGRRSVKFQGAGMPEEKTLDIAWDERCLYDESTNYNNDMAVAGIILSEAAYSNNDNCFNQFGYSYVTRGSADIGKPAFYIGYKVTWDFDSPKIHIIVAIRGTKADAADGAHDVLSDVKSVTDCFESTSEYIMEKLTYAKSVIMNYLNSENISLTKRNTKYLLVGHSLGAACAGKTGVGLVERGLVNINNIYVYTYACPRNIIDWDQAYTVPRHFNIINSYDTIVPNSPTIVIYNGIRVPIRAGNDKTFCPTDSTHSFMNALYQLYGEHPGDRYTPVKAHMTPIYLAVLLSKESSTTVSKIFSRARYIAVDSSADIDVYDSDGTLCAQLQDNKVDYSSDCSITITMTGNKRYISIPDGNNYTIRYSGTGNSTMKVEDRIFSLETGDLEYEKVFENVALEDGKQLESHIDGMDDTENTDLNVVDEEGDPVSTVDEHGTETLLGIYDLDEGDVVLPSGSFRYSGAEITPTAAVDGLTEGVDYRVIYKNNTTTGTATVVVKGINDYRGRYTSSFSIYGNGDVDGNGEIEVIDTTLIQRYISQEKTPYAWEQLINGDVDSSGDLEITDATAIQYYLAQLKTPYPIGIEN